MKKEIVTKIPKAKKKVHVKKEQKIVPKAQPSDENTR